MSADFWGSHDLVAACLGAVVQAWNPFTSTEHATLPDHYGQFVNTVRWTYNSKVLACGGDRGTVSLYNNGSYLGGLPGAVDKQQSSGSTMDAIQCLRITKDSKRLIAGCRNKLIFLWDLKTQSIRGTISDHRASISSLFISPDDTILASSSAAGDVLLHQMANSQRLGQLPVEDSRSKRSLCFTPCDPTLLAASSEDGSVYVWDIKTLSVATLLKHKHVGGAMGVQLSPSQPQLLFSCGMDKRLVVWDRRSEKEGQSVSAPSSFTCLSARDDSLHLAAGTQGGVLLVYDVRNLAQPAARLSDSSVPGGAVSEVHWKRSSSSRRSSLPATPSTAASQGAGSTGAFATSAGAFAATPPAGSVVALSTRSQSDVSSGEGRALVVGGALARNPSAGGHPAALVAPGAHLGTDTVTSVFSPIRSTPAATPMQLGGSTPDLTPHPSPLGSQMAISPIPMPSMPLTTTTTATAASHANHASHMQIKPGGPALLLPKSPRTIPRAPSLPGSAADTTSAAAAAASGGSGGGSGGGGSGGGGLGGVQDGGANGSGPLSNGGSALMKRIALGGAAALPALGAEMDGRANGISDGMRQGSGTMAAGVQAGLSEEVFKAYMDQATSNLNSTLQNLHVDLLRQFTIQMLQMQARFDEVSARQTDMQAQIDGLQAQLEQFLQVQRWGS